MRSTFDLDGDGKMTMVEMKKKTEDMMAEMRVSSQRHIIYIRTVMSGSRHLDSASNDEFSVECLF